MKKFYVLVLMSVILTFNSSFVSAEKRHKHDSQGMEQAFDQFLLLQFNDEIKQAIKEYYKKDSIRVQYYWWDKDYDVVEIDQSEKGHELSHPYVIKFTVLTYDGNKSGQLGQDSITFGVSPLLFNKEMDGRNIAGSKVELLDYKHVKPSNKKS